MVAMLRSSAGRRLWVLRPCKFHVSKRVLRMLQVREPFSDRLPENRTLSGCLVPKPPAPEQREICPADEFSREPR